MIPPASPERRLALLLPGDPLTLTGGYLYDQRIAVGLRERGWQVDVLALHESFPQPTPAALADAHERLQGLAEGALVLIDGLALGAMPDVALRHAQRLRLLALVHHPLALETGLDAVQADALRDSERRALQAVRAVIVTSAETAANLGPYGVAAERITVIEPGTDLPPLAQSRSVRRNARLELLAVATLSARKGHALLFEALAALRHHDWHLTCVGSATRDAATAAALQRQIEAAGLQARITLQGEVDQSTLQQFYHRADVFVQASHHEGYGMALAEALAQGLPAVSTATGAAPRLLASANGLLVEPGSAAALQSALTSLLVDVAVFPRLAEAAWRARDALRSWSQAAADCDQLLATLASEPAALS